MKEFKGVVGILGQGYVGLPLAIEAAKAGWRVIGIDKKVNTVNDLNLGISHVEDVLDSDIKRVIDDGMYSASSDVSNISLCDYVIICVPTPLTSKGEPDIDILVNAVTEAAPYLKDGCTLISESTSFPGTVSILIKSILDRVKGEASDSILLCSAPERVDPLNQRYSMRNTPRLISGVTEKARDSAYKFYSSFCDEVISVSSPMVAEFAKLLENTFRQVNIALINQLTPYIRSMGVDVREVVDAAGSKPYGFMKFYPGAGPGGHCIPVDPVYLSWFADKDGFDLSIIKESDKVNRDMAGYVADRLVKLGEIQNVLIVGAAYKPNVSDVRESSAIRVGEILNERGLKVYWYDPLVDRLPIGERFVSGVSYDAVLVLVKHEVMDLSFLEDSQVPILDCTGTVTNINVERL